MQVLKTLKATKRGEIGLKIVGSGRVEEDLQKITEYAYLVSTIGLRRKKRLQAETNCDK